MGFLLSGHIRKKELHTAWVSKFESLVWVVQITEQRRVKAGFWDCGMNCSTSRISLPCITLRSSCHSSWLVFFSRMRRSCQKCAEMFGRSLQNQLRFDILTREMLIALPYQTHSWLSSIVLPQHICYILHRLRPVRFSPYGNCLRCMNPSGVRVPDWTVFHLRWQN